MSGVLPAGLQHLEFGRDFNQPIEPGVLPHGLQHLEFGSCSVQLNPGVLPASLSHLTSKHKYNGVLGTGCIFKILKY